jgi:hypothetical protein
MAAFLPAIIGAAGAIGGGYLAGRGNKPKETKLQKTQRHLIDELLGSVNGGGRFSDLFNSDQGTFEKSFLNPAKSMFQNQIAPQIQQSYIASGQQRGTGLEDQLLRAGVDLDQILNQQYSTFQNQGKDRLSHMLMGILGGGAGAQQGSSGSQDLMSSAGGFLTSKGFQNMIPGLFNQPSAGANSQAGGASFDAATQNLAFNPSMGARKGYAQDNYGAFA